MQPFLCGVMGSRGLAWGLGQGREGSQLASRPCPHRVEFQFLWCLLCSPWLPPWGTPTSAKFSARHQACPLLSGVSSDLASGLTGELRSLACHSRGSPARSPGLLSVLSVWPTTALLPPPQTLTSSDPSCGTARSSPCWLGVMPEGRKG